MTTKETESDKDKRIARLEARMTALENKKRARKPTKKKAPKTTGSDAIPPDSPPTGGLIKMSMGSYSETQLEQLKLMLSRMQKDMTALRNQVDRQDNSMKSQFDETNQRLKQLESTISPPEN